MARRRTISNATVEGTPQASPAMTVASEPRTPVSAAARTLAKRHPDRSELDDDAGGPTQDGADCGGIEDRTRQAADACLQEDVRERRLTRSRGGDVPYEGRVAFRREERHLLVAAVRRIGDFYPAVTPGTFSGDPDRIVVGAGDLDHLGPETGDSGAAPAADLRRHEEDPAAAEQAACPGERRP